MEMFQLDDEFRFSSENLKADDRSKSAGYRVPSALITLVLHNLKAIDRTGECDSGMLCARPLKASVRSESGVFD